MYEINTLEEFILALNTLKQVDTHVNAINNGIVFETTYTDDNDHIVNVQIKKKGTDWQIRYSGINRKTGIQIIQDEKTLRNIMFNLI